MTELSIDTKARMIRCCLQLAGETKPVEIHVRKYALTHIGTAARLTIVDADSSRQWLSIVLRRFIVGRSLTIPSQAEAALKLLA